MRSNGARHPSYSVKAGIVKFPEDYEWSSFSIYTGKKYIKGLIDKNKILSCLSSDLTIAVRQYMEYVTKKEETEVAVMDIEEDIIEKEKKYEYISTPEQARIKIKEIAKSKNISYDDILKDKEIRNEVIRG